MYLGTAFLVIVSLLAALVLHIIPNERVIGLLGLVPLILGIRAAIKRGNEAEDEEKEESDILERLESRKAARLFWTIALITVASGGDNLGVYIPYFVTMTGSELAIMVVVFILATAGLCVLGYRLAKIPFVANTLEKYERIIVPIVYIALGIYIMAESGTLAWIFGWLG
jgi:cadmium resistance transport/sequestration family protein